MFNHPRWVPQPNSEPPEVIITFEFTRNFYREVAYREEFERYCDWYYKTALKNQQELNKMRGDINLLGWFLRG